MVVRVDDLHEAILLQGNLLSMEMMPTLNAGLNALSACFLVLGYVYIRRGQQQHHQRSMVVALCCSALFLGSYLVYHYHVGSVPYPHRDWTRPLYFAILVPHVVLAALVVPFVLVLVWHAWRGRFDRHKKLARWVWPVWIFVSASGVLVYLMLYHRP
jgi:uncharacterized membrane protein YozB (DUF420 family)